MLCTLRSQISAARTCYKHGFEGALDCLLDCLRLASHFQLSLLRSLPLEVPVVHIPATLRPLAAELATLALHESLIERLTLLVVDGDDFGGAAVVPVKLVR